MCMLAAEQPGAEDGGHVGLGRAGGAPARQDVVFHIEGAIGKS